MKVLLDTSPLSNANAARGIGTYTRFLLSRLLDQAGNDLEIFQSGTINEDELKNVKADIIHYPYFDFFSATLPLKLITKTVVTIHDVIPLIYPQHYPRGKKGALSLLRQKLALKSVNRVITDSEASKQDIIKYLGVDAAKIRVIYLAANPDLKPVSTKVLNRYARQLKLPKNYILYVGDINYNKNLPQLIKSLKYLDKNIKLLCVGKSFIPQEIPEWQAIETQLALSNVTKRVKFLNNILGDDPAELASIYQGAIAYVQPSIYEGFGLPILEAMQCQTPVICGKNSSLPEVAGKYSLVLADENAEEIAARVEEVFAWNKKKRREFLSAAANWAKAFSWEKTAAETIALYQELNQRDQ